MASEGTQGGDWNFALPDTQFVWIQARGEYPD